MFCGPNTLSKPSVERITMPVKEGGMGLPDLCITTEAAYIGSWASALPEVLKAIDVPTSDLLPGSRNPFAVIASKVAEAQQLVGQYSTPAPSAPKGAFKMTQRSLTSVATKAKVQMWHNAPEIDVKHKAWARSCGGPGAGSWLLPATHPSAVLADEEFRSGISLRLYVDQVSPGLACPFASCHTAPKCNSAVDPQGVHLLGCPTGGGLVTRHDSVRDALRGLVTDSGKHTHIEQVLYSPVGQLIGKSDLSWANERCGMTHVDVSIVSPVSLAAIKKGSHRRDGTAAEIMEASKLTKYLETRCPITPFVLESGGRLGPKALGLLRASFRDPQSMSHVYQILAAQMIRANASALARARQAWANG